MIEQTPYLKQFTTHRHNALRRGIEFLLTYEEWFGIWKKSGHLSERGRRKGQYVMARKGDKGPYQVGNVKIITMNQNLVDGGSLSRCAAWANSAECKSLLAARNRTPEARRSASEAQKRRWAEWRRAR